MSDWRTMKHLNPDDPPSRPWKRLHRDGSRPGADGSFVEEYSNPYYDISVSRISRKGERAIRIMVVNADQSARRDWREFQRIKNEICGDRWVGYEIYPPKKEACDPSNAFFLWCFPAARLPEFCNMNGPRHLPPEIAAAPQRGGER